MLSGNCEARSLDVKRRLPLVDDDEHQRWILTRSFERRGYEVKVANNAAPLSALLEGWHPDYAVVDVRLPGPGGLMLIPQLKSASPGVRIVMVSGYASIAAAVQAIKLGATQYLVKPVDAATVEAAFRQDRPDVTIRMSDKLPSVDRLAWEYIQRVLMANKGNVSATARALRMHRKTLQRKLSRHPPRSSPDP
jgi:two-component system response regulator RegA